MKKLTQLKDQEHSPKRRNNEADLFSLIDTNFRKEIIKILTEEIKEVYQQKFRVL